LSNPFSCVTCCQALEEVSDEGSCNSGHCQAWLQRLLWLGYTGSTGGTTNENGIGGDEIAEIITRRVFNSACRGLRR
jgi:hypothetical protein